jgi:ubiquinone/menaquinone biosynthesis C-methylase UbiE
MNYEQIAQYYDRYVTWDVDIPYFLKETAKTTGEVLELMCGTGRLSLPFIEAGIKLTCVDRSSAMLRILQEKIEKRGLVATIIQQNVCELNLDKQFDLIILPFHAFAELVTTADQIKALNSIYKHLTEHGRFLCPLHNPIVRQKSTNKQLHLIGRNYSEKEKTTLAVWSAENYSPLTQIVEGMQLFEVYDSEGKMISRTMIELNFCLLERTQFERLAISSGFKVSGLYGDYSYAEFREESSPAMIFELHR